MYVCTHAHIRILHILSHTYTHTRIGGDLGFHLRGKSKHDLVTLLFDAQLIVL